MAIGEARPSALELQPRDSDVLRGLFESRVMTTDHASALYFDGNYEAARKRLQKLKSAGFITERPRQVFGPSVLFLTRKGLEILRERGVLAEYPPFDLPALDRRARVSDLTIRHELEIMDVKVAFDGAMKRNDGCTLVQFSTWPRLHEFTVSQAAREVLVKPDGFIQIAETKEFMHEFFLEVDRSTEEQERLVSRAVAYREHYGNGGHAIRRGAKHEQFRDFPFRVLMVMKSNDRRNNTAERLLQCNPPILSQVCLTTLKEVVADPLGSIWIQPKDYRAAVAGSRFDPERPGWTPTYYPQAERNTFVEARIRKFQILSES